MSVDKNAVIRMGLLEMQGKQISAEASTSQCKAKIVCEHEKYETRQLSNARIPKRKQITVTKVTMQ